MYNPKYSINNTIIKNIGIIEAAREVINHVPLLPYYEKEFQNDAMVRSVHHGTHIEGNELNLDQAERIIQGQQVVARARDIQEVINYRKVMGFLGDLKVSEDSLSLDENFLKKMNAMTVAKILPPEKCGEYRMTQVVVRNSLTGEVTFKPPAAIAVPLQVQDLLAFIANTSLDD